MAAHDQPIPRNMVDAYHRSCQAFEAAGAMARAKFVDTGLPFAEATTPLQSADCLAVLVESVNRALRFPGFPAVLEGQDLVVHKVI